MTACDFSRSFATFVTQGRGNNARIQVEAVCDLPAPEGETRYVLVASCKAEDTYAADALFRLPNYDFCAIFSTEQYCIVRAGLPLTACWRESGLSRDRFEQVRMDLSQVPARACADAREIVETTLGGASAVGRTELLDDDGELLARLEYPVKTMNVNDLRWVYQVDTGPIIVPDIERQGALEVDRLALAFIAWNRPDRAELIVQAPTRIAHSDSCVAHYREVRGYAARNELLVLER
ncbi:MAG: hypothetical protein AB7Y46_12810 [Armatimonadota bacterium]